MSSTVETMRSRCLRRFLALGLTQRGITLIEALIALLILALGVLGLAVVQARMLVETRTTNARATAIRLIDDLRDRINMNAAGAQPPTVGASSPYADDWFTGAIGSFPPPPESPPDACTDSAPCTPENLAKYDMEIWRQEVARALLNGRASVLQNPDNPQQLQVIVAWQANENTNVTVTGTASGQPSANQLADQLQVTSAADNATNLCPDGQICHVDFIDIPPP